MSELLLLLLPLKSVLVEVLKTFHACYYTVHTQNKHHQIIFFHFSTSSPPPPGKCGGFKDDFKRNTCFTYHPSTTAVRQVTCVFYSCFTIIVMFFLLLFFVVVFVFSRRFRRKSRLLQWLVFFSSVQRVRPLFVH